MSRVPHESTTAQREAKSSRPLLGSGCHNPRVKRLPFVTVLAVLAVAIAVTVGGNLLAAAPIASPAASPSARASDVAAATPSAAPSPSVEPSPATPSPTPATVVTDVAIVPVTQFRTAQDRTGRAEVAAILAGTSKVYEGLELVSADADAILAALGVARPSDETHLILAKDAATLATDLAKNRKRLAFLRADQVGPSVRALGWGDRTLFGGDAVENLEAWGLSAQLEVASGTAPFDPAATWTLVAGGDIMLDRGVAQTIKIKKKGVDFPFDGGTADITGRCKDCSAFGWDLPYT